MTTVHEYKVRVEYNDNPGEHPIAVTVYRHGQRIAELYGKSLAKIMRETGAEIGACEVSEQRKGDA